MSLSSPPTITAVNSEGEAGPTSMPISATIPGRVKQFFFKHNKITVGLLYSRWFLDITLKIMRAPIFEGEIHIEKVICKEMCRCCECRKCVLI